MRHLAMNVLVIALLVPAIVAAEGKTSVGPFYASVETECSGSCEALDEKTAEYGASLLFRERIGSLGGFVELAATDRAFQAAIGPAAWIGDIRILGGLAARSGEAEYEFGGRFGTARSSENTTAYIAEIAWKGLFARYTRHSIDHTFKSTVGKDTRRAEAEVSSDALWAGYRFRLPI